MDPTLSMGNRNSTPADGQAVAKRDLSAHGDSKTGVAGVRQEWTYKPDSHLDTQNAKVRSDLKAGTALAYGLVITLSCAADGSKRERDLGLKSMPETVADIQCEIQKQFNIPIFDQKLMFGPSELSSKESLKSHGLRNGDHITVEYSSDADLTTVSDVVSCMQKTLTLFQSFEPRLHLIPISPELDAEIEQSIDQATIDAMINLYVSTSTTTEEKKIVNSQLFIASGGLDIIQQLQALLLRLPFKSMTFHTQVLEISLNRLVWALVSCAEMEAAMMKEMKWGNILLSLYRVSALPDVAIVPPRNDNYAQQYRDVQINVVIELLDTTMGCLSCALEYNVPHIRHGLATDQKFMEQILGAMQNRTVPFKMYLSAMCVILDLAFDIENHDYLCKPHVIQAIIRTWKSAEPTPENNATLAESVYLKYLAAVLISLLCTSRQRFTSQYHHVVELLKSFLDKHDHKELQAYENELGFKWNKYLPYMRVVYFPHNSRGSVMACGSDPSFRALQMMCVETCVLSLHVVLYGERQRKMMVEQDLMEYIICLPSVLPEHSSAQWKARDLVSMLGKEMHLQPPSLNTMARARLAVSHFGLEKAMKTPVQELTDVFHTINV